MFPFQFKINLLSILRKLFPRKQSGKVSTAVIVTQPPRTLQKQESSQSFPQGSQNCHLGVFTGPTGNHRGDKISFPTRSSGSSRAPLKFTEKEVVLRSLPAPNKASFQPWTLINVSPTDLNITGSPPPTSWTWRISLEQQGTISTAAWVSCYGSGKGKPTEAHSLPWRKKKRQKCLEQHHTQMPLRDSWF